MAKRKQKMTIENSDRSTSVTLLIEREACRLSVRQVREAFKALSVPGHQWAGKLGEWPLIQFPPECGGAEGYRIVEFGKPDGRMSNLYFLPLAAAEAMEKDAAAQQQQAA